MPHACNQGEASARHGLAGSQWPLARGSQRVGRQHCGHTTMARRQRSSHTQEGWQTAGRAGRASSTQPAQTRQARISARVRLCSASGISPHVSVQRSEGVALQAAHLLLLPGVPLGLACMQVHRQRPGRVRAQRVTARECVRGCAPRPTRWLLSRKMCAAGEAAEAAACFAPAPCDHRAFASRSSRPAGQAGGLLGAAGHAPLKSSMPGRAVFTSPTEACLKSA